MNTYSAIDPFGSEGIEINLDIDQGMVIDASARKGYINQLGLFDPSIKESCSIFNRTDRITSPMLRKNGKLVPISLDEAIDAIKTSTDRAKNNENATFISPQFTNELMYMLQKWSRCALKSDAIGSFQYIESSPIVNLNKNDNVPMHELIDAKHICVFASELNTEHPILHQLLQYIHNEKDVQITFITNNKQSEWLKYSDNLIVVKDYLSFIRAINYHIISTNHAHGIFIDSLSIGYDKYKESILKCNFQQLLDGAGVTSDIVEAFAKVFVAVPETVMILSEKSSSLACFAEIKNLMLLTEKQAKPSAGMMYLKSECNSQGIFDMGILPGYGPGFRKISDEYANLLKTSWGIDDLPTFENPLGKTLKNKEFKNIFIFGENPIKTHSEFKLGILSADFVCVQSLFENETTEIANLVLPLNFAIEIGGSYASSFKTMQNFKPIRPCPFSWNDYKFFASLSQAYNLPSADNPMDIFFETAQFFETGCCGKGIRHHFTTI